ncbi:uncharacterized protein J3R85_017436 [Psidium guajava]|nr:uncharacterized protein J3R85_017436 [Psidium guajava]
MIARSSLAVYLPWAPPPSFCHDRFFKSGHPWPPALSEPSVLLGPLGYLWLLSPRATVAHLALVVMDTRFEEWPRRLLNPYLERNLVEGASQDEGSFCNLLQGMMARSVPATMDGHGRAGQDETCGGANGHWKTDG